MAAALAQVRLLLARRCCRETLQIYSCAPEDLLFMRWAAVPATASRGQDAGAKLLSAAPHRHPRPAWSLEAISSCNSRHGLAVIHIAKIDSQIATPRGPVFQLYA